MVLVPAALVVSIMLLTFILSLNLATEPVAVVRMATMTTVATIFVLAVATDTVAMIVLSVVDVVFAAIVVVDGGAIPTSGCGWTRSIPSSPFHSARGVDCADHWAAHYCL